MVDAINESPEPAGPTGAVPALPGWQALLLEIKTLNLANMVCTLPGKTGAAGVYEYTVELPQTFNESSGAGVTYIYTSINDRTADGTETQRLTPPYLLNDLVLAVLVRDFWLDANVDGRQWAKVP